VVGDRRPLAGLAAAGGRPGAGRPQRREQYAPLALGLTTRRLSLPGGELASWVASWALCPASSSAWCSWCCCSPTGGCRRAAGGRCGGRSWSPGRRGTGPCHRRVRDHAHDDARAGGHQRGRAGPAVPPRRGGAGPADQVVAYQAAPSVPLGMFAQAPRMSRSPLDLGGASMTDPMVWR
jgi:hypothetical protein